MRNSQFLIILLLAGSSAAFSKGSVGTSGEIGTDANPKKVNRLEISKPGVYENYLVDGNWASGNLVKITADKVTLRNCEIRYGRGNGIGIFGKGVVIENCRIHHMLNETFDNQSDAHGISGRWGDTVIRNCDISYCSGDCIQFDPDRVSSGRAVIENCNLWTSPLTADHAGFRLGQRPGENAFDSKTMPTGDRCKVEFRNCILHGFKQPGQIVNMAALNLKENVDAIVADCVFFENELALRVRGPGERGGARVEITDCRIYESKLGIRAEDGIELLKITGLGFGKEVTDRIQFVKGRATAGYSNVGEYDAPPMEAFPSHTP